MDSEHNSSYSVGYGPITEDEIQYEIEKGLAWEDSKGEICDVSTDVDEASSFLSQSQQHSLILFEENEKLYYCETRNGNSPSAASMIMTPPKKTEDAALPVINVPVSHDYDFVDEDEDKENRVVTMANPAEASSFSKNENRLSTKSTGFKSSIGKVANPRDKLVEIARSEEGIIAVSPILDFSSNELSLNESLDNIDVVPCTQHISMNYHELSNVSTVGEEYINVVPCTQQEESTAEDSELDLSSVPCSQASATSGGDLDDTITTMTKLLALADEQEAKEKMCADNAAAETIASAPAIDSLPKKDVHGCFEEFDKSPAALKSKDEQKVAANPDGNVFKTPLRHDRLKLLKRKHLYTPSPPRTHVDELLQRGQMKKSAVIMSQKSLKIVKEDSPSNTSTPKRAPLNNITPLKKPTGVSSPKLRTPVTAKVDSGLRPSPFSIGLSPVANYIYSKPAPSTFARVTGIPNPNSKTSNNSAFRSSSATKIPLPPSRPSQAQTTTPGSSSKEQKTHSVLRTSTYFNMSSTPPKIVLNEKSETKRFQPLKYTGSSKVKGINGRVETPKREEYLAHRHTGLRDDSGNASFIQKAFVQQRNIPQQSRLVTPQNFSRKD